MVLTILALSAVAADVQPARMSVATVNAWGLPPPIAPGRARRLPQLSRWLERESLDLVGLQEVWRGARALLDPMGLRLPGHGGDSGLGVVTPHPVLEPPVLEPFTAGRGVDAWKSKGVLHTVVDLPLVGRSCVLVTHLQAGRADRFAEVRAAQVDQLLAVVNRCAGPVLLLGDFNLEGRSQIDERSRGRLEGAGLADLAPAAGPTHRVGERYDRIYLRTPARGDWHVTSATAVAWPLDAVLSDHLPVRATVELTP